MFNIFTPNQPNPVTIFERLTLFYSVIFAQKGKENFTSEDLDKVTRLAFALGIPTSSVDSCLIERSIKALKPEDKHWLLETCIDYYCPVEDYLAQYSEGHRRPKPGYKFCIQVANTIGLSVIEVDKVLTAKTKEYNRALRTRKNNVRFASV